MAAAPDDPQRAATAPRTAMPARDGGEAAGTAIDLRILATTDLHGQLLSWDYFANRPQNGFGLARTACLIAGARDEVPGAILLDNGDFLQGSALTDLAARHGRRRPHPAIAAFNTLGYDAVALGNHEFDYGLDVLRAALAGAGFPALSANVVLERGPEPRRDRLLALPFALIRRRLADSGGQVHAITAGVLGLTPPQILDWNRRHLAGRVSVRGMAEAARAWLPEMRRAGAGVVICLAHSGVRREAAAGASSAGGSPGDSAADLAALPGIDAVIAGHSHLVWPPEALPGQPAVPADLAATAGKPVVQPGHSGSHLGVIDLRLARTDAGWRVERASAAVRSTSESVAGLSAPQIRAAAAPLRRALDADHRGALERMHRPLGWTAHPLHSYFATVTPSAALQLMADAKADHVRRLLTGRPEAGLPVLAAVTPFRSGGRGGPQCYTDIPAGRLTLRSVLDLYPYPNTLVAEEMSVAMLAARLERAARIYPHLPPGSPERPLVDPESPVTTFEVIPGLSWRIDLTRPDRRIGDLRLDGRALAAQERLVLVSNSFRAATCPSQGARLLVDDQTASTEVLAEWLRRGGQPRPPVAPGWRFALPPGTGLVFDTGAGALAHLDEIAFLSPEFLGVTPAGFHRFRLHL